MLRKRGNFVPNKAQASQRQKIAPDGSNALSMKTGTFCDTRNKVIAGVKERYKSQAPRQTHVFLYFKDRKVCKRAILIGKIVKKSASKSQLSGIGRLVT